MSGDGVDGRFVPFAAAPQVTVATLEGAFHGEQDVLPVSLVAGAAAAAAASAGRGGRGPHSRTDGAVSVANQYW